MIKLSFLEKLLGGDFIELRVHNNTDSCKDRERYMLNLVNHLSSHYPQVNILSVKKANLIEFAFETSFDEFWGSYILIEGYRIRITPNVELKDLKKTCMELETNNSGKRIGDIDIYYKHKKISRHTMEDF